MPKKTTKKTSTKPVVKHVMKDIPLPDPYCHCTKRKRNTILTSVSVGCLLIGIFLGHMFFCPVCPHKAKPHVKFDANGCAIVKTIKCPKLLKHLSMIDVNNDGCISEKELDFAEKVIVQRKSPAFDKEALPQPTPVEEPAVVDAIAPAMED